MPELEVWPAIGAGFAAGIILLVAVSQQLRRLTGDDQARLKAKREQIAALEQAVEEERTKRRAVEHQLRDERQAVLALRWELEQAEKAKAELVAEVALLRAQIAGQWRRYGGADPER